MNSEFSENHSVLFNMDKTIVFTDSRGAHLRTYLDEIPLNNVGVYYFYGARLTEIVLRAMEYIYRFRPKLVIFLGGINDTTSMNPISRKIQPRFRNHPEMCEHFTEIIKSAQLLLHNAFPEMTVVFGGVIGADLRRYNHAATADPRQPSFDDGILELNRVIRQLNILSGAPHVYFTGKVHKWFNGLCHHQYFHLYDGLHPGEVVLRNWASLIADLHSRVAIPRRPSAGLQRNDQ